MNNRRSLLIGELALVIAGVFVFRSLWMLLDTMEFMHTPPALWSSLIAGSVITVWALHFILKHDAK
jgi:hypothetical protein